MLSPLELLELPEPPDPVDVPVLCDVPVLPVLPVLPEEPADADELWVVLLEPEPAERSTVAVCAEPGSVAPMPTAARMLAAPAAAVTDRSLAWLRFRAATAARVERRSPPRVALLDAGIVSLSVCVHPGPLALALGNTLGAELLLTL